jgi:hypothetical protein
MNFDYSIYLIYKLGEAEREILTLAPHFESKALPESFDTKLDRLNTSATQDITWLHLLSTTFIFNIFIFEFILLIFKIIKMQLLNVLIIVNYFHLIVMLLVVQIYSFYMFFHV